jgi:molecular chaperone GrpE (heat shock protein)
MSKRITGIGLSFIFLLLSGCENLQAMWEQPAKQMERLQKENRQLRQEVESVREKLARSDAEGIVNHVLVALYDLRHALEKFALQNNGEYPYATNINELQSILKSYLPENFAIEAVYLEKIRSQKQGYIMIANVKGQEIVVSNLL